MCTLLGRRNLAEMAAESGERLLSCDCYDRTCGYERARALDVLHAAAAAAAAAVV